MKYVALSLLAVLINPITLHAKESPFLSLTFEQACTKAKKEKKAVFIDFYTIWCGPCHMLDNSTWKDKKVIALLKEKTVPLKIDAEANEKLASKYSIESYPSLVFIKPDGSEIDRISGYVTAEEFLPEAEGILSGKDALTRAREKLDAAGKNDPSARMDYAKVLSRIGKHEEALAEYLWCFDEGMKKNFAYYGVRLSFLLSNIARLGEKYPPALEALRQRRDAAKKQIQTGKGSFNDAHELQALNQYLDEAHDSLDLYDELRTEHPDWEIVDTLGAALLDDFRESHRYNDIIINSDIEADINQIFKSMKPGLLRRLFGLSKPKDNKQRMPLEKVRYKFFQLAKHYETFVGACKYDRAADLAERMLAINNSAWTYGTLAYYGHKTGAPVQENLDQARKAYKLNQEKNIKDTFVLGTLIALLDHFGHKDEGLKLVKSSMQKYTNPKDREYLQSWLDYYQAEDQPPKNLMSRYLYAWDHLDEGFTNIAIAFGPPLCFVLICLVAVVVAHRRRQRIERNESSQSSGESRAGSDRQNRW